MMKDVPQLLCLWLVKLSKEAEMRSRHFYSKGLWIISVLLALVFAILYKQANASSTHQRDTEWAMQTFGICFCKKRRVTGSWQWTRRSIVHANQWLMAGLKRKYWCFLWGAVAANQLFLQHSWPWGKKASAPLLTSISFMFTQGRPWSENELKVKRIQEN